MLRLCIKFFLFCVLVNGAAAQTLAYTLNGAAANSYLGRSVAQAGDVNGDGISDFIVNTAESTGAGGAIVFSGADGSVLHTFVGDSISDAFGHSVAGAGDVNNDGFADVIVGAFGDDNAGSNSGSARVFSGFDGSILYTFNGDSAFDNFGKSVAGAGDVNGDGFSDLIVGAPSNVTGGISAGSARVFSGADGAILYTVNGASAFYNLGSSVAATGDVNGDGFSDVIVGAPGGANNGIDSGAALVLSGVDGSTLFTFDGDSMSDRLGESVAGAGDVNGDGIPDFIVGIQYDDNNGANSGAARVYSGLDGSILHTFVGDVANQHFGRSVSGAGDVNGDGHADLMVGTPFGANPGFFMGLAKVMSGADGSVLFTLDGDSIADEFGTSVSSAGDVNGDGFADFLVGNPGDDNVSSNSGSAVVYLSPTLPTLKFRSALGTHALDLSWIADGVDPLSVTGTIVCAGATPGGLGVYGASLARIDFLAFGYLPLVLAIDSINLLETGTFGYDFLGQLTISGATRQIPFLAGSKLFIQFFESSPIIASSTGLRVDLVP